MERWLVQTLAPTAAHGFACDALWSVRAAKEHKSRLGAELWEASIHCSGVPCSSWRMSRYDTLHKAGASILAATTIKEALELIARAQICAAIVDVKLGGHDCSSVCAALTKRSIPFM